MLTSGEGTEEKRRSSSYGCLFRGADTATEIRLRFKVTYDRGLGAEVVGSPAPGEGAGGGGEPDGRHPGAGGEPGDEDEDAAGRGDEQGADQR